MEKLQGRNSTLMKSRRLNVRESSTGSLTDENQSTYLGAISRLVDWSSTGVRLALLEAVPVYLRAIRATTIHASSTRGQWPYGSCSQNDNES